MSLFTKIFGGSRSSNQNNSFLKSNLGSTVSGLGGTSSLLASLLGQGDPSAGQAAFGDYKKNSGFNFLLGEGLKGITGASAAKGILNSGSAGKAFMRFGDELSNTHYNDYIKNLLGLGNLGLGAAGVLQGSGQKSSSDSGAFGKFLGSILSDRRFKKDVEKISTLDNGLGWYSYSYIWEDTLREGLMADEVLEKNPSAVYDVNGTLIVNYETALKG